VTIRECHYHESILSNFEDRLAQEQVQDEENNISNTTKGYPEEAEEIEKSASNADNTVRKTIPSSILLIQIGTLENIEAEA
jgi:hypothetical protein